MNSVIIALQNSKNFLNYMQLNKVICFLNIENALRNTLNTDQIRICAEENKKKIVTTLQKQSCHNKKKKKYNS